MNMIERVARAIEIAGQHRPYGLYDYSNYKGNVAPHVVKDERTGERLFKSSNREEAYDYWRKITQGYVAKAAIAAMREPSEEVMNGFRCASVQEWNRAIDIVLQSKEE